jgi:hypothetical protein
MSFCMTCTAICTVLTPRGRQLGAPRRISRQEGGSPRSPEHVEAGLLFRNRPRLSTVFQESRAELASADVELALDLSFSQAFHDAAEKMLTPGEANARFPIP